MAVLAAVAAGQGIWSTEQVDVDTFTSIHGQSIDIHARGLYKYMSADVAIQGIAQDYVTLMMALPLLLASCLAYYRGSIAGGILLVGHVDSLTENCQRSLILHGDLKRYNAVQSEETGL